MVTITGTDIRSTGRTVSAKVLTDEGKYVSYEIPERWIMGYMTARADATHEDAIMAWHEQEQFWAGSASRGGRSVTRVEV